MKILVQSDFENGLSRWARRGPAEFATDSAQPHEGHSAARITVPVGGKLNYQQLSFETGNVTDGDVFDASAWVRAKGLSDGSGAYLYIEFLSNGRRIGIVHSPIRRGPEAEEWTQLRITAAAAPKGVDRVRIGLVLHAHGTAWFDDVRLVRTGSISLDFSGGVRTVTVDANRVVLAKFGGVGFHVFYPLHPMTRDLLNTVIAKRWRELQPSFARVTHLQKWTREDLDRIATNLAPLKATGTEIYVTTWDPRDTPPGAERRAYVRHVVDQLEYLVRDKGFDRITTYCMTNELSLGGWGKLRNDLDKFRDYHRLFFAEFKARGLNIQLLATDASPVGSWNTIEWATKHMDAISGIYGGHHYLNRWTPDDLHFYPWFFDRCQWGAGMARSKGKDFILGEFGCKQDGRTVAGVKRDVCLYWDTPTEALVGIQLCEAAIAAVNAGVYAMGNWTFADFPDEYNKHYINKWGTFKWSGNDHSTRPHYYAYGLLTHYFRGPATVFGVEANDPLVRAAALRSNEDGGWSLAAVNRNRQAVSVEFRFRNSAPSRSLRRYVYDPAHPPSNPFGDLQPPSGSLTVAGGKFEDSLPGNSLVVYATAWDNTPPLPVSELRVDPIVRSRRRLRWTPCASSDLCCYRVYRGAAPGFAISAQTRVGSTIVAEFADEPLRSESHFHYAVTAVDSSGNESVPTRTQRGE